MKIGILGSGDVGQALGRGFVDRGHEVKLGTRSPDSDKVRAWLERTGEGASADSFEAAARFGELAALATLWTGTQDALDLAGPHNLAGKVLIDATNPLLFDPGAPPRLALGHTDSGGEQVQRWLPDARVVKAFNIVGNRYMVDPDLPGGPPDMFICGNDAAAKRTVTEILESFGWRAIDIGGIEGSRLLEPLCILWVVYGFSTGSWDHAFKLLRRNEE